MSNVLNGFRPANSGDDNEFFVYGSVDANGKRLNAAQYEECLIASGFYDYNDAATSVNPLTVVADTPKLLTNDGQGQFTSNQYGLIGVENIYDTSTNSFDFSGLNLGDVVGIRVDISVTTDINFQELLIYLALGSGGSSYTIPWVSNMQYKTAGVHRITGFSKIYMGNQDTIDSGGQFYLLSPDGASVIVHGWFVDVSYRRK